MREVLRNMFRRKTRTLLTVFGITIGIFAFTVMGSMAEKINLLVSGGTKYYADKVIISGSESLFLTAPFDLSHLFDDLAVEDDEFDIDKELEKIKKPKSKLLMV